MRTLLAGIAASLAICVRSGVDLMLNPGAPVDTSSVAQRAVTRPVVDGLKVASRVVPSRPRAEHGTTRGDRDYLVDYIDPATLYAIKAYAEPGDVPSWEATLEDIVDIDEALAEHIAIERCRDREDAEIDWLDCMFPERPSWPA